ncbi:YchJ family protein [Pseudoalteromonas sp. SIMBA_153]
MTSNALLCFCGSQQLYADCCEPFHLKIKQPQTPEQLMRARYSAYAVKNAAFVRESYAKEKQAENSLSEIKDFATSCRFINLTVLDSGYNDETGFVKFKAHYFYQDLYCELAEHSKFIKEDEQWRYLDGEITPVADIKVKRNDTCPCGSNKKYKKCHSV